MQRSAPTIRSPARTLPFAAIALALAAGLSACSSAPSDASGAVPGEPSTFPAGSTMAQLRDRGGIAIGVEFDQPLFGLAAGAGEPAGFDVEIGRLVAQALGIPDSRIEWVRTASVNREDYLIYGKVDLVVATYTITEARERLVDFAGPYLHAGQRIMVAAGTDDITGESDLAGRTVCAVQGSTGADTVASIGAEIYPVSSYSECLAPLAAGRVDAMQTDDMVLEGYLSAHPGEFELVGETLTDEPYGIGVRDGDTQFTAFIDEVLRRAIADGTWARLWDETAGAQIPLPATPTIENS